MLYPFCHTITDEKLGVDVVPDFECEIDATVEFENGNPILEVHGVYKDGQRLLDGAPLTQAIAAQVMSAAEDDEDLLSQAMANEGVAFIGRGALDPGARFVRRTF
ncbi:MAG: hypothetical protein M9944_12740 [Rhizobiaceae bacterium]|nr:hypothetical protein [Rhizobiaceae bacterium]